MHVATTTAIAVAATTIAATTIAATTATIAATTIAATTTTIAAIKYVSHIINGILPWVSRPQRHE